MLLSPDEPSTPQDLQRFDRLWIPVTESGCWLWLGGCDEDGYGKAKVNKKHIRAHRWAWMLFCGEIPANLWVLHRCDVPSCVNPDHLFLGTNLENVDDRERKGRGYAMPIHREPKVTEAQVLEIRKLRGLVRQVDLGKRFGIHNSQISRIQRGLYWAHLDAPGR